MVLLGRNGSSLAMGNRARHRAKQTGNLDMFGKKLGRDRLVIVTLLAGVAFGLALMLGAPQILAKTETPDFCASCHVMEAQYESWFHEGAHRRKACVDCHLPNDNVLGHYFWKSIDGMKDVVVFNSGRVPDDIRISDHGRSVVQANCIRCHESTVEAINQERLCTDCHRRLMHRRSGATDTL